MKIAGQRGRTLDIRASLQIDHFLISLFIYKYQIVTEPFLSRQAVQSQNVTSFSDSAHVHKTYSGRFVILTIRPTENLNDGPADLFLPRTQGTPPGAQGSIACNRYRNATGWCTGHSQGHRRNAVSFPGAVGGWHSFLYGCRIGPGRTGRHAGVPSSARPGPSLWPPTHRNHGHHGARQHPHCRWRGPGLG